MSLSGSIDDAAAALAAAKILSLSDTKKTVPAGSSAASSISKSSASSAAASYKNALVVSGDAALYAGSVVDRLFGNRYRHHNHNDDNERDGVSQNDELSAILEEEIFLTCGSYDDIDDGASKNEETSILGTIQVMDESQAVSTKDAIVAKDAIDAVELWALPEMLCASEEDVLDDIPPAATDTELMKQTKKSRFGWFLAKSKADAMGSGIRCLDNTKNGVEMIFMNAATSCGGVMPYNNKGCTNTTFSPKLVRRTRFKKKNNKKKTMVPVVEERAVIESKPVGSETKAEIPRQQNEKALPTENTMVRLLEDLLVRLSNLVSS
jgi:hypothetical protein